MTRIQDFDRFRRALSALSRDYGFVIESSGDGLKVVDYGPLNNGFYAHDAAVLYGEGTGKETLEFTNFRWE